MFSFRKPTADFVSLYLQARADEPFSYSEVGVSRNSAATQLRVDTHRVPLGTGEVTFQRSRNAIKTWQMFPREMVTLYFADRPIESGTIVAVLFRAPGFWSLNPAKIVYVIDDEVEHPGKRIRRFGFAYGTLADHLECGEEQFLIEWNLEDDTVFYRLTAYSRPQHWLVWLGYPYARQQQARFRRLSGKAMQRAVKESLNLATEHVPKDRSTLA